MYKDVQICLYFIPQLQRDLVKSFYPFRDHNSSYNTKMTLNYYFLNKKNTYHQAPMEIIFSSNIAHYIHSRPLPAHYYLMKKATNMDILFYEEVLHFILSRYLHNVPLGIMCCMVAKLRCFLCSISSKQFQFPLYPFLIMTKLVKKVYGWGAGGGRD